MSAIADSSGKFLARSVLRTRSDEYESPFLLLEPVYKSKEISEEEAEQGIYEGALQKAESLGLPLFTKTRNSLGFPKTIITKGRATSTYYSDLFIDKDGSHIISGKIAQKLATPLPLLEITRN